MTTLVVAASLYMWVTQSVAPPKAPPGLEACKGDLTLSGDVPRKTGETIRYLVEVSGISVGTVDFRVEREGLRKGTPVTEYRSLFRLDALLKALIPMDGRAVALVPKGSSYPAQAMHRYASNDHMFEELVGYSADGRVLDSVRHRDGKKKVAKRTFVGPARDFVSAFYAIRRLPPGFAGCTVVYGDQKAYTMSITYGGRENVETPVGQKPADRYDIKYGHEKSKKPYVAQIWLGTGAARLPYRAIVEGKRTLDAKIHMYQLGK